MPFPLHHVYYVRWKDKYWFQSKQVKVKRKILLQFYFKGSVSPNGCATCDLTEKNNGLVILHHWINELKLKVKFYYNCHCGLLLLQLKIEWAYFKDFLPIFTRIANKSGHHYKRPEWAAESPHDCLLTSSCRWSIGIRYQRLSAVLFLLCFIKAPRVIICSILAG